MFQVVQKSFLAFLFFLILIAPTETFAACVGGGGGLGANSSGNFGAGGYISIGTGNNCNTGGGLFGGSGFLGLNNTYGLPSGSVFGIIANIVNWLLALFGILGILGFIVSGIMYLISAGDDDMVKRAKAGFKYSIIGIIVGLSGFFVMQAINGLLSGVAGQY